MPDEISLPLGGVFQNGRHILPVRIYYEDTDFSGVVYHANYLRYLERGRSDCLRLAGVHHADLWAREEPLAFTIQRINLEFVRPARIDDILYVHTQYTRASGARIEARQVIVREDEEVLRAQVFAACINDQGQPRRMPREIVAALTPHLVTEED